MIYFIFFLNRFEKMLLQKNLIFIHLLVNKIRKSRMLESENFNLNNISNIIRGETNEFGSVYSTI